MDIKNNERIIDPIGIELGLTILSTALTAIAFIYQFGSRMRRRQLQDRTKMIRREVLRLQNAVDDLVLTLERISRQQSNLSLSEMKLTVSETLFQLRQKDYQRWILIQDAVERVHRNLYDIISDIRELDLSDDDLELSDSELIHETDRLILRMGELTFDQFIIEIRRLLERLDAEVAGLLEYQALS